MRRTVRRTMVLTELVALVFAVASSAGATCWEYGPALLCPREYHGVAKDGAGIIYVFGGCKDYDGGWVNSDTIEMLDEAVGEWQPGPYLGFTEPWCCVGATAGDGYVYAVGGPGGMLQRLVGSAWESRDFMNVERGAFGATTDYLGRIWAVGGDAGVNNYTNSVEFYDPWQDDWYDDAPLNTRRANHAAVAWGTRIYVIGGILQEDSSFTYTNTVEFFDLSHPDDGWQYATSMPTARANLAAVVVGGQIWAIGGYSDESGFTGIVEMYDPVTDSWVTAECSLNQPRNALAAIVGDSGTVYAIGGGTYQNPLNVVEVIAEPSLLGLAGVPLLLVAARLRRR
jgi:hypothetical protein